MLSLFRKCLVNIGHYREYNPQGTDDTPLLYLETLLLPNTGSKWTVCAPSDLNLFKALARIRITQCQNSLSPSLSNICHAQLVT